MSYHSEHRRLRPVLDKARELNIATNPAPEAIYDPLNAGFNLWCTPGDKPQGWQGINMVKGAFAKPCDYVAGVYWRWNADDDDPRIVGLDLHTTAYALRDAGRLTSSEIHNRLADIAWAKSKIRSLFALAGVDMMPIHIYGESDQDRR